MNRNNIGANIKKFRELKNLTQEYLAQELNMSQSQYQRIEAGRAKVTEDIIKQVSEIFEIAPETLFEKFDEKTIFQAHTIQQAINNNYSSGNVNLYPIDGKLEKLYENQIRLLEGKIVFLEAEIERLKSTHP